MLIVSALQSPGSSSCFQDSFVPPALVHTAYHYNEACALVSCYKARALPVSAVSVDCEHPAVTLSQASTTLDLRLVDF
jgi:hypothetical protein